MVELNATQINNFQSLIKQLDDQIDITSLSQLQNISIFQICKNVLLQVINKQQNINMENLDIDLGLQEILIVYHKSHKRSFNKKIFIKILNHYLKHLKDNDKYLFYFSPLYNFSFDGEMLELEESVKIRKITEDEKLYLFENYKQISVMNRNIRNIMHVIVVKIDRSLDEPNVLARTKMIETISKFKLIKQGDIRLGGLHYFKNEYWNPNGEFERIEFEPMFVSSANRLTLRKKDLKKFYVLLEQISQCYPSLKKHSPNTQTQQTKHGDYFERTIDRFHRALDNNNANDKVVDLTIALEILLVYDSHDNITSKLSIRTALFIGRDEQEKKEIWPLMKQIYNFRSLQVHESREVAFKVNDMEFSKNKVSKKLQSWTQRAILQMILFSQEEENLQLKPHQLCKKIDESMFDEKLAAKFSKMSKEILKNLVY